jgi:hypothetical protein
VRWLIVFLLACSSKKESPPPSPPPVSRVTADAAVSSEALDVVVDKRVELLSIVMRLAGADEYNVAQTPYAKEIDKTFGKFKDHAAVRMTRELRAKHGISYDAPMVFAVHLDGVFALHDAPQLVVIDKRWQGVDLEAYAAALRSFAADTKLVDYFNAHAFEHEEQLAAVRTLVNADNPVPFFDELFGLRRVHTVVLGLLLGTNNVGVRHGDNFYQILSTPTLPLLVHEMAHSYINPLFAKHAAALEPAGKALFPLFAAQMRNQKYGDWQTMFNESGVRALVVLFMRTRKGDVAGAAAARDEMRASFLWINELTEVFRKYQRAGTKDEAALMAQVTALFDGLVKQYGGKPPPTPFIGPFDAVLARDYVLAVAPGPAADYAKKLPFFATKRIVDPAAKVEPGIGIVAYGTPSTNALIAQIASNASWKITADGIELGAKKFPGKDLVLIATWFRLDDPTRGVAVYAAADERALVGINGQRHGPRDWLVARRTAKGYEVVETGDWPVDAGAWVPFK